MKTMISALVASTMLVGSAMAQSALPQPPAAAPAEFNIWAGSKGLTFREQFAPRIQKVLEDGRFAHQIGVTNGTPENFDKVCANGNDVGVGQADVLYNLVAEKPNCKIVVVKSIAKQCVFGVTNVPNMDNLYKAMRISFNLRIGITPVGSGARSTFENILKVSPDLKDATLVDITVAKGENAQMKGIEMLKAKQIDLMIFTGMPDPTAPVFSKINEAGLTFMSVGSAEIFDMKAGDVSVYTDNEVRVKNASWGGLKSGQELKTACTDAVIFTGAPDRTDLKKSPRFQQALITLLQNTPAEAFRPGDDWLSAFMNAADAKRKELMAQAPGKAREAYEAAKKAAENFSR